MAGGVPTTVTPGSACPPPCSTSSSTTRSAAASQMVGSTPRSLRLPASEVSLWRRPVRNIDAASQWAASTRTEVVESDISVVSPPITPAEPDDAGVVGDDQVGRVEHAVGAVEGREPLALARTSYDDRAAQLVGVVAVDRPAGLEHHVVGDVDGEGDRPHPGSGEPPDDDVRRRARSGRSRSPCGPRRPGSPRRPRPRPGSPSASAAGCRAGPGRGSCSRRRPRPAPRGRCPRIDSA